MLQIDIRLYFPSIDHQILMMQLRKKITCLDTLWLIEEILANGAEPGSAIDSFPGDSLLTPLERPRGLPIGNLTSQYLANLHLNAFDHTVRSMAGIRAYLRYVDDGALFADHPEPLQRARVRIEEELVALRLRPHPVKTQMRRTLDGASFVGFHVVRGVIRLRNHSLLRGRRRLRTHVQGVAAGVITADAARASLQSWNAHLAHGPGDMGRVAQLLRGGSWINNPRNCRSAYRNKRHPDNRDNNVGFRLCVFPPAPFTVRAAGRDSSGSTRGS